MVSPSQVSPGSVGSGVLKQGLQLKGKEGEEALARFTGVSLLHQAQAWVPFSQEAFCDALCHETTTRAARLERGVLVTRERLVSNVCVVLGETLYSPSDFATLPVMKGQKGFVRIEAWWKIRTGLRSFT